MNSASISVMYVAINKLHSALS